MVATVDVGISVWSPDVVSGSNNLLGNDGYVELRGWRDHWEVDIDSECYDLFAHSDVSNFAFGLLRLTAAGERDAGFGSDGFAWRHIGSGNDSPSALVLQADGRIVLAGHAVNTATSFDVALARFGADGAPDSSFGNGGAQVFDLFNGPDGASDLLVQPDGRLLAAGSARNGLATLPLLLRLVA